MFINPFFWVIYKDLAYFALSSSKVLLSTLATQRLLKSVISVMM